MAEKKVRAQKPAIEPEAREKQLARLAYDLAEKQLIAGTASPSVIAHFLRVASKREELEQDTMRANKVLIDSKAESIVREKEVERIVKDAMESMTKYRPSGE